VVLFFASELLNNASDLKKIWGH